VEQFITDITRAPSDLVEAFSQQTAATVYEAAGKQGAMDRTIRSITPSMKLCGSAFTVRCHPADNLTLHAAIALALPGDVIVAGVSWRVRGNREHEPELERPLRQDCVERLSTEEFAQRLSAFFMGQWPERMPQDYDGPDMVFLVGGYDENASYGRVFRIGIPSHPEPKEYHGEQGQFGPVWGGELEYANRLLKGFDPRLPSLIKTFVNLSDNHSAQVEAHLEARLSARIPYQFLSLQDCVDLSVFLIRATIIMQPFTVDVRGVGGPVDVATITRTEGFKAIQQKVITGER